MACSIETLLDLSTLSIVELSSRLAASEGRGVPDQEDGGHLLLTAEEWSARQQRGQGSSSGSKGSPRPKPQGGGNGEKEKGGVTGINAAP
jgi:hypothetical protein